MFGRILGFGGVLFWFGSALFQSEAPSSIRAQTAWNSLTALMFDEAATTPIPSMAPLILSS